MQRAINAEAKAALKSSTMIRDLDIYCSRDYLFSNNTFSTVQNQGIIAKDFSRPKKPKTKDLKSALLCDNITELAKIKNKQKKLKCRQECIKKLKKTQATGNNTIIVFKKNSKKT